MYPHSDASSRCLNPGKPRDEHRGAKLGAMTILLEVESTKADVCGMAT